MRRAMKNVSNLEAETDENYKLYHYVTVVLTSGHVIKAHMISAQEAKDTVERIATAINSNTRVATESPKRVAKVGKYYVDYAEIASFCYDYTYSYYSSDDC